MEATLVEVPNAFEPHNRKITVIRRKLSIRNVFRKQYSENFIEFDLPTVVYYNGKPTLRRQWDALIVRDGDILTVLTQPGWVPAFYWIWYLVISLLLVAIVVVVISKKLSALNSTGSSPAYSLQGKNNQEKLGNPIEVPYGQNLIFPSYAAQPYNQYINNNQYLFQFFCLGQGVYDISQVYIGTTPISSYPEIEYEIVPPGASPTLFPTNVLTASTVNGIQLLGPNQTGYTIQGPFVANPSGSASYAQRIEIDIQLPGGLYKTNSDGTLGSQTIGAVFQAQQIDQVTGAPIGPWITMFVYDVTYATTTPQRVTQSWTPPVLNARWQIQAYRTSNHNFATGAQDSLTWASLRCFCPDTANYGNVTCIGMKALADYNLNDQSAQEFNVLCTRMLPIYNPGTGTWSAPTATRSPIWAFCDMAKAEYGLGFTDQYLDLVGLVAINNICIANNYCFDWIFDQSSTFWEAAKLLALTIRSTPIMKGPLLGLVRDTQQTIPVAMFGPDNIVKGSFQWQIKLLGYNPNDGIELTYYDGDDGTYLPIITECELPGIDAGQNPLQVFLYGVTSLNQAWREGMYQRAVQYYLRENITIVTGLEGFIPSYGDLCVLSYDIPRWATAGLVTAFANTGTNQWTLTLNNAVNWLTAPTSAVYKLSIRYKNGTMKGPWSVSPGVDNLHVIVTGAPDFPSDMPMDNISEFPLFFFGYTSSNMVGYLARLVGIQPNDDDTVQLTFSNYDSRVYQFDAYTPPAPGNTQGSLPAPNDLPVVTGLEVLPSPTIPTQAIATWNPVPQAKSYVLQVSYDGQSWTTINGNYSTSVTVPFQIIPMYIYVRVAAINSGQGPWDYWFGEAPTPIPAVPPGFTATPGIGKSINLAWTQLISQQSLFYAIYRNTTNNFLTATEIATIFNGNTYIDAPLTPATQYFYWIEAVNYAGIASGPSAVATATTVASPPDPNTPVAPAAATVASGAITSNTGLVTAYFDVTVPAPAPGCVMTQIQYKLHSAPSTGWQVAGEATTAATCRISDLATATLYDIQTVAFDAYYTASPATPATGSPFSVTKGTSPTNPSGFSGNAPSATYPVPPAFQSGGTVQYYGGTFSFLQATDTDIAGYQWAVGPTGTPPTTGIQMVGPTANSFFVYTTSLGGGQHVWMRSLNTSGVYGAWLDTGIELNTFISLSAGTIAAQNANAVNVSNIQTGQGGSSQVQVETIAPINPSLTLAGGSPEESFSVSIANLGFTTKPDVGVLTVSSDSVNKARYDWADASNSSTVARIKISRFDGTNTVAATVRVSGTLTQHL